MNRERQLAQAFVVLADTMPRGSTPCVFSTAWFMPAGICWTWTRRP